MRILIQRVAEASVETEGKTVASIGKGLVALTGFSRADAGRDDETLLSRAIEKMVNLRIFEDSSGKMNLSLLETGGELLLVSQFTLYAETNRSGRRPSFTEALDYDKAKSLFEKFVQKAVSRGIVVQTGIYGANMAVSLVNDGPVTIPLEF